MILASILPSDFWTDQTIPVLGHLFGLIEYVIIGGGVAAIYGILPGWLQTSLGYGLAIIAITVLIRLALFPLMSKQTRSMRRMQQLQPEIKKVQEKYKNDRQLQQQEVMKLYKANDASPVAGCLPLLLQMPVLLAMFRVFNAGAGDQDLEAGEIALPGFFPEGSQLVADLEGSTLADPTQAATFLGVNLGASPSEVFSAVRAGDMEWYTFVPYVILILLIFATGWFQQQQLQKRTKEQRQQQQQPAGMQAVQKIFPFMFVFFSWGLASAVSLYFLTTNLFSMGQQWWVLRDTDESDIVVPKPEKPSKTGKGKAPAKSGQPKSGQPKSGQPKSGQPKSGQPKSGQKGSQKAKKGDTGAQAKKRVPKKVAPKAKRQAASAKGDGPPGSAKDEGG